MMNCSECGAVNAAASTFCGECGSPLAGPPVSPPPARPKSTRASDRIVVSRDTQGEVSVQVVRPEGRYLRHQCRFCGKSVKVPEGAVRCPSCGGQLGQDAEETVGMEPAITDPRPRDTSKPLAVLYHLLRSGEETPIPLENRQSLVGRLRGVPNQLIFERDPYLSPLHAEFRYTEAGLHMLDLGSLNGVFGQIRGTTVLGDGQMLLIGEQVFRFELLPPGTRASRSGLGGTVPLGHGLQRPGAKLVMVLADGGDGPEFYVGGKPRVFGRNAGHYTFPEDPLMSGQHARIEEVSGHFAITDLKSTNGTMVRVPDADLEPGAVVGMGSQRFRVEFRK